MKPGPFKCGDRVTTSGFAGRIIRQYSEGMYEVRLESGLCCVPTEDIRVATVDHTGDYDDIGSVRPFRHQGAQS